ncbi:MAG: hypothetical protein H7Z74_06130 [Anaerolineae bacterium]|nr:hypothetical protein [Gemmatimonadaceae bacterium]
MKHVRPFDQGIIWPDASSFLATRDYARWTPRTGVAAARDGRKGWDRAVRATLSWARDCE